MAASRELRDASSLERISLAAMTAYLSMYFMLVINLRGFGSIVIENQRVLG